MGRGSLIPVVREIMPVSPVALRVKFDTPISGGPAYIDPDNYRFTEGLEAVGVVLIDESTVEVLTTQQEVDRKYKLSFEGNEQ